jgi:hypothetical protein
MRCVVARAPDSFHVGEEGTRSWLTGATDSRGRQLGLAIVAERNFIAMPANQPRPLAPIACEPVMKHSSLYTRHETLPCNTDSSPARTVS